MSRYFPYIRRRGHIPELRSFAIEQHGDNEPDSNRKPGMYFGKRGPRRKRSSSSFALEPNWRRSLRAPGLLLSGMADRKALR